MLDAGLAGFEGDILEDSRDGGGGFANGEINADDAGVVLEDVVDDAGGEGFDEFATSGFNESAGDIVNFGVVDGVVNVVRGGGLGDVEVQSGVDVEALTEGIFLGEVTVVAEEGHVFEMDFGVHASSQRMRPHWSQVTGASFCLERTADSTSPEILRWQPEQVLWRRGTQTGDF